MTINQLTNLWHQQEYICIVREKTLLLARKTHKSCDAKVYSGSSKPLSYLSSFIVLFR